MRLKVPLMLVLICGRTQFYCPIQLKTRGNGPVRAYANWYELAALQAYASCLELSCSRCELMLVALTCFELGLF